MLTETLRKLLGDEAKAVREIGPKPFVLYLLIRAEAEEGRYERVDDWDWRGREEIPGDVLFVEGTVPSAARAIECTQKEVPNYLQALMHSGWLYDYYVDGKDYTAVVATATRSVPIYAVEEKVATLESERVSRSAHPTSIPSRRNPGVTARTKARMAGFKKKAKEVKAHTDKLHEANAKKFLKRDQEKTKKQFGYTGASSHGAMTSRFMNEDGSYKANDIGLLKMYEHEFIHAYSMDPPKVLTGTMSPTAKGRKLTAIASEFTPEEAMKAVEYAIRHWSAIKEYCRTDEYPGPEAIWRLRSDLCMSIRADEDPLSALERKNNNSNSNADAGEWTQSGEDDSWCNPLT